MIIGVPREIKKDEYRVALLPVGAEELARQGHRVLIEASAGLGSGLPDDGYHRAGAEIVSGPEEVFGQADLVLKVKEPLLNYLVGAGPFKYLGHGQSRLVSHR